MIPEKPLNDLDPWFSLDRPRVSNTQDLRAGNKEKYFNLYIYIAGKFWGTMLCNTQARDVNKLIKVCTYSILTLHMRTPSNKDVHHPSVSLPVYAFEKLK